MEKFSDIIGHSDIINYMKYANMNNKLAHAYILSGESGMGKTILTDLFVKSIMCEELIDGEPCGECITCTKIKNQNHPDVIRLIKDKKDISINEIREQINRDVEIKPYIADRKIYIIPDAQSMSLLAQNAILKTIEEPPEYVTIILEANNAEALLQTIQSRCVVLKLKNISDTKLIKYLIDKEKLGEHEAKMCAAFAQGNIGKALKLSKSDEFNDLKILCVKMLQQINTCKVDKYNEYIKELVGFKASSVDFFDILTIWYRDVLIYKSTKDSKRIIFQDNMIDIKKISVLYKFEKIEEIFSEIEMAKTRLRANINYELVIELLLRKLKEQ